MKPIPYARQSISEEDIAEAVRVLRSDFLTQGPAIDSFEAAVASYCGAAHAVAFANATAALHAACAALGVGPGDSVWTSPNTFVASANCALYCGASVDFVDIDPGTLNLSAVRLAEKLAFAKQLGKLPRVVIAVHFAGQSCEMQEIHRLSGEYGFRIIEDASHAIGGDYKDKKIGSCQYSDITIFSFHPVKIITTGEGGMIVTNNPDLRDQAQLFRSHGITRDAARIKNPSHGPWYYEQVSLGFNYRITDLQAALGESQLRRIDSFIVRRNELASRYQRLLADLPVRTQQLIPDARSSYHLFTIRIQPEVRRTKKEIFEELRARGILVNLHYIPVYLQPYYRELGFSPGLCPEAERYYAEAVSLPMFADLSDEEQDRVCDTLAQVLA